MMFVKSGDRLESMKWGCDWRFAGINRLRLKAKQVNKAKFSHSWLSFLPRQSA